MMTDYINLTEINSTVMDLYILPYGDWHEDELGFADYETFNSTCKKNISSIVNAEDGNCFPEDPNVNFTWKVTTFEGKEMNISLNFTNPYWISQKYYRDLLTVHVRQDAPNILISQDFISFGS